MRSVELFSAKPCESHPPPALISERQHVPFSLTRQANRRRNVPRAHDHARDPARLDSRTDRWKNFP
jgi:hypothetical protein